MTLMLSELCLLSLKNSLCCMPCILDLIQALQQSCQADTVCGQHISFSESWCKILKIREYDCLPRVEVKYNKSERSTKNSVEATGSWAHQTRYHDLAERMNSPGRSLKANIPDHRARKGHIHPRTFVKQLPESPVLLAARASRTSVNGRN